MNIERMERLALHLEAHAQGGLYGRDNGHGLEKLEFDMASFVAPWSGYTIGEVRHILQDPARRDCGTSACMAGWACLLYGEDDDKIDSEVAMSLLGLDYYQARRLFYNDDGYIAENAWGPDKSEYERDLCDITPEEGAAAIRRMVEEGDNG